MKANCKVYNFLMAYNFKLFQLYYKITELCGEHEEVAISRNDFRKHFQIKNSNLVKFKAILEHLDLIRVERHETRVNRFRVLPVEKSKIGFVMDSDDVDCFTSTSFINYLMDNKDEREGTSSSGEQVEGNKFIHEEIAETQDNSLKTKEIEENHEEMNKLVPHNIYKNTYNTSITLINSPKKISNINLITAGNESGEPNQEHKEQVMKSNLFSQEDCVLRIYNNWNDLSHTNKNYKRALVKRSLKNRGLITDDDKLSQHVLRWIEETGEEWEEWWESALEILRENKFLQGENQWNFVATFRWLFVPNSNGETGIDRIIQGVYNQETNTIATHEKGIDQDSLVGYKVHKFGAK